jgi:hypothetical protein
VINLEERGFKNIKNIYVCEFISGHGGDFFITLYSTCNKDFLRFLKNKEELLSRFDKNDTSIKFRMPGNNIGGKIMYSTGDMEENIINDLNKLLLQQPTESPNSKFLNIATHPYKMIDIRDGIEKKTNISISSYIYNFFESKYEYKNIILVPTTFESFAFIEYFRHLEGLPIQSNLYNSESDSVINSKEIKGDIICIDHIDIALNCEGKLLSLCKKLVNDNYDEDMFEMTLNYYKEKKLEKFLDWLNTTPLREQLEEKYNENKQEHAFTVINSKNIDEFLK